MLVLSRKPGQTICIGDNITVTVLGLCGNALKLGIDAPRGVRVLRSELQRSEPSDPPWPNSKFEHQEELKNATRALSATE